jgi:hypothetical protein
LVKNAAEFVFSFENQNAFEPRIERGDRGGQSGGAAPDDDQLPRGRIDGGGRRGAESVRVRGGGKGSAFGGHIEGLSEELRLK